MCSCCQSEFDLYCGMSALLHETVHICFLFSSRDVKQSNRKWLVITLMHDKPLPQSQMSPTITYCFVPSHWVSFSLPLCLCLSINLFVYHTAFSLVYSVFALAAHPIIVRDCESDIGRSPPSVFRSRVQIRDIFQCEGHTISSLSITVAPANHWHL